MVRSQSVSNISDKRNSGILMSLRSRKSSSKDLNAVSSKPRTLSQAMATVNTNTAPTPKRHSVFVASSRYGEDKENSGVHRIEESRRALKLFRSRATPSSSKEKTLATMGLEPCDVVSMETLSLDRLSPHTPIKDNKLDTTEYSPLAFLEFASYITGLVEEPPSSPAKLHRTVNLSNIKEFVKSMDDSIVPIGNRKSLDFEANEIRQLQDKLNNQGEDLCIYLVENALFMSFFQLAAEKAMQRLERYWDEIDADEIFKTDKYDADENIYLHL